jgi:hypothetical protein
VEFLRHGFHVSVGRINHLGRGMLTMLLRATCHEHCTM